MGRGADISPLRRTFAGEERQAERHPPLIGGICTFEGYYANDERGRNA
jgi:hypothetical protein